MANSNSTVDTLLLITGTATGLVNLESILGIIILVIQLLWLGFKLVYKIITSIKEKKSLDTLDKDVEDLVDFIEESKNNINKQGETKNE